MLGRFGNMDTKSYPTDTAVTYDDWDRTWTKYVYDFDSLNTKGRHLIEIQMPHAIERWGVVLDDDNYLVKVDDEAITFPDNPHTYYTSSEKTKSHLIVTLKVEGNRSIDCLCVYHDARPGLVFTLSTQLLEACKIE